MKSITELLDAIMDMVGQSNNKATIPFSVAFRGGMWWVYVEMDSRQGTFDLEHKSHTLEGALRSAHKNLRRELPR